MLNMTSLKQYNSKVYLKYH